MIMSRHFKFNQSWLHTNSSISLMAQTQNSQDFLHKPPLVPLYPLHLKQPILHKQQDPSSQTHSMMNGLLKAMPLILSSLLPSFPGGLAYIIACSTSIDVWNTLEKHYLSNSRVNIMNLKFELQNISKKEGESINSYISTSKNKKLKVGQCLRSHWFWRSYYLHHEWITPEYNIFWTSML